MSMNMFRKGFLYFLHSSSYRNGFIKQALLQLCALQTDTIQLLADQTNKKKKKRKEQEVVPSDLDRPGE